MSPNLALGRQPSNSRAKNPLLILADRYPQSPVCGQILRRLRGRPQGLRRVFLRTRPASSRTLWTSRQRADISALIANHSPARTFHPDVRVQHPPRSPGYWTEVDCKTTPECSTHGGEARSALTSSVGRLPEDRKTSGHHHECPEGPRRVRHRPRHWSHSGTPPSLAPHRR